MKNLWTILAIALVSVMLTSCFVPVRCYRPVPPPHHHHSVVYYGHGPVHGHYHY